MLKHPIVEHIIAKNKSTKMFNLNVNELFLYRIIVFTYYEAF